MLRGRTHEGFQPQYPKPAGRAAIVADISRVLGLPAADVDSLYDAYLALHKRKRYQKQLGEKKTLCFEEAFILFVLFNLIHPVSLVEIGTQYGKSTRRMLDMKYELGLATNMVCFDVADEARFFAPEEAQLVIEDVTGRFKETVLDIYEPDLLYLDARPYALLKDVIGTCLRHGGDAVLTIHDCGRGLCNPHMALSRADPAISSHTGIWERHVLAEIFGVSNPLDARLDDLDTDAHRLRVFPTTNGLAVLLPKTLSRTWKR